MDTCFWCYFLKKTAKVKVYWTILPKKGMIFSYNEQYFDNMKHNIDIIDK